MQTTSSPQATLIGIVGRIVFASEETGWSVVQIRKGGAPATAVGNLAGIRQGEKVELTGRWVENRKYGQQFEASSYRTILPTTVRGIQGYLGSGLIKGIGKVMAERLVEHFGEETLEVIEKEPERLSEVSGFGPKRIAAIRQAWVEQREIQSVMLFLTSHGVSTGHALKIYKNWGSDSIHRLREDPYRLATDIRGIGFKTADKIAADLGIPPDSPHRARAALLHLLGEAAGSGHLFEQREPLVDKATELLAVDRDGVAAAFEELVRRPAGDRGQSGVRLVDSPTLADERGPAVYLTHLFAAEAYLGHRLRQLVHAEDDEPTEADPAKDDPAKADPAIAAAERRAAIVLAPRQREAVRLSLSARVLVVTGGPGTGKTTLIRTLVDLQHHLGRTLLLAAPTGRAAKRLSEATGREAKTIHRTLEYNPQVNAFERNEEKPLDTDLLIVDEASMLDTQLASELVAALPDGARLVLVGDVDQLPSVGPGNVLADIIRSAEVPVVRLDEIFRQAEASAIVINAHRIRSGELPELAPPAGRGAPSDFFFIERREPEAVLETLVYLVSERIPSSFGFDPMRDIQVLAPMNRGLLGVETLNERLRATLNPSGKEVARSGRMLRVGDKVMQIRNNYDLDVFNGDLGRVLAIDAEEQQVVVDTDGKKVVYDFADLDELTPAYACTIHKSQGSEYPCVVIPVHNQHYVMLERNLLYTAVTRARRLAVVVGERRALRRAVERHDTRHRATLLAERLRGLV